MNESAPLIVILRQCAASVPWYPRSAAETLGLSESDLIACVEQLRHGGLIVRTDPVPGHGRGYVLTPAGAHALKDPGALEWLSRGEVPPPKTPTADGERSEAVSERERAVRQSLLAPFRARVVRLLIVANVGVFLWGLYLAQQRGISTNDFLFPANLQVQQIAQETGAVKITDVRPPSWGLVRLLTCCFVHFGLIHLGANMLSLYFIGPLLERMWGHFRFLVLYLIAGFGGSCAAMVYRATTPDGQVVTLAGASGAVWGIMASMAVWVLVNRRYMPRRLLSSWGLNIIIVFGINIAITQGVRGVSAEAHYGGGIVGAACAVLLHLTRFGPLPVRALAGALVAALPILGLWMVTHPPQAKAEHEQGEVAPDVMPQVLALEKEANRLVPGAAADPIVNTEPNKRDPARVRQAIKKYAEAEERLREAIKLLNEGAPYNNEAREEGRKKRLKEIEDRIELYSRNRRRLEAGER